MASMISSSPMSEMLVVKSLERGAAVTTNGSFSSSSSSSISSGGRSIIKHPYKYVCPFCGKKYTSRSGLLSHKNTVHFQRKPYRCEYCNQHFHTSANRVGHIRKMHPGEIGGGGGGVREYKKIAIRNSGSSEGTIAAAAAVATMRFNKEEYERALIQRKKYRLLAPRPPPPPPSSTVSPSPSSEVIRVTLQATRTQSKQPPPPPLPPFPTPKNTPPPSVVRIEPAAAADETAQILYRGGADRKAAAGKISPTKLTTARGKARPSSQQPMATRCHKHPPVLQPRQDHHAYKCLDCLARFEDSDQLVAHVRLRHPVTLAEIQQDLLECPICPGLKLSKKQLIEHVRTKHMAPLLRGQEEERIRAKDSKPPLVKKSKCLHCDKLFPCMKRLKIHMKFQHTEAYRNINGYSGDQAKLKAVQKCDACQQDIATGEQEVLHKSLYCNIGFPCSICLRRFPSVSDYMAHLKASENSCCQEGEDDQGYRGAMRTNHHLLCPICGFRFRSQTGYIAHLCDKHGHEITDFSCTFCAHRSFDIKETMNHVQSHSEANKCDITFVQELGVTRPRRKNIIYNRQAM